MKGAGRKFYNYNDVRMVSFLAFDYLRDRFAVLAKTTQVQRWGYKVCQVFFLGVFLLRGHGKAIRGF